MRTGHDASFAARHTTSATSRPSDRRRPSHSREDTPREAGVGVLDATLHPGLRVVTEAGLWILSRYHQAHSHVELLELQLFNVRVSLVNAVTAALLAVYTESRGSGFNVTLDVTFTMTPAFRCLN